MYGNIEVFSIIKFLEETYPTEDDTDSKQELIDYLTLNLSSHNNVKHEEMDHFMDTCIIRLRAISDICKGVKNMDDCPVNLVDDITKTIDKDLAFILRNKTETMMVYNKAYYLNLSSIPDSIKFYKELVDKNKVKHSIQRKQLESFYNECNIPSNFSNVLFSLSWLNVLRVYGSSTIYFNRQTQLYF